MEQTRSAPDDSLSASTFSSLWAMCKMRHRPGGPLGKLRTSHAL
jgi:hypothetical protein